MTKNEISLSKTVGFKAEAIDEEGVWCACTVKEVNNNFAIVSFDSWNAEWNRRVCDPIEIRDQTFSSFLHVWLPKQNGIEL